MELKMNDYVVEDGISSQVGNVVDAMDAGTISSLKNSVDDIDNLIASRIDLHKKLLSGIDKVEHEINNFLLNRPEDMGREELILFKEKKIELSQSKRDEELSCWKDIARLKQESREIMRELEKKQTRKDMLDSILK